MAKRLGTPLMPWQELVALVGGEIDPDTNLPAYRDVIVTVPRQSGKTTLVLCWEVHRATALPHLGPQRVLYSAQTGNDARSKLIVDQFPVLKPRKKMLGIKRCLAGMGNEAVEFLNGSRIFPFTSAEEAGHGKTLHMAVKDELWADRDDRRDQAIVPAMATIAAAQVLTASTMGTVLSVPLNAAVERGRQAVERGVRSGTAYFEWSAEADADPDDESVWWGCMPALGHTIDVAVVRHARSVLSLAEFRRAFLNIKDDRRGDPVIPLSAWRECGHDPRHARLPNPITLAVDVSPDRMSAIAAAAVTDSGSQVQLIEHGPETGWVPQRVAELRERHKPTRIVLDPTGPAGSLLTGLERAGVQVELVSTRQHQQACGDFLDAVVEKTLVHTNQAKLNAAVDAADKRPLGDAWLWSRKSSNGDISPLVACTLARWAAAGPGVVAIDEENLSVW